MQPKHIKINRFQELLFFFTFALFLNIKKEELFRKKKKKERKKKEEKCQERKSAM